MKASPASDTAKRNPTTKAVIAKPRGIELYKETIEAVRWTEIAIKRTGWINPKIAE
jgi:hypothetical protein